MRDINTGGGRDLLIDRIFETCLSVPADFGGGSSFEKVWVMAKLAEKLNLRTYVEIGVYRGRSFLPLARAFGELGGFSYGVDPYSREEAMEHDVPPDIADAVKSFINSTDYGAVYRGFLERQMQQGLTSVSMLIRETSDAVMSLFNDCKIYPDMVHVDGNHDIDHALRDVQNSIEMLSDRGILVIDDINWASVEPALSHARQHLNLIHETSTYAVLGRRAQLHPDPQILTDTCRRAEIEALEYINGRL